MTGTKRFNWRDRVSARAEGFVVIPNPAAAIENESEITSMAISGHLWDNA
jgi:hypothetical protein